MFNQEIANQKKDELQRKSSLLIDTYPNIVFEWCTGSGKSRTSMLCIERSKSTKKWLIVVPEIVLIDNFKRDIGKHGIDILDKIEDIICYASLKNYERGEFNILLDEGHHSGSELRLDIIKSIKSDERIVLSATIKEDIKQELNSICNWYVSEFSLKEAIDSGILPEPEIEVVYLDLDDKEIKYPYKIGKKILNLTAKGYYSKLTSNMEYWRNMWEEKSIPYQYTKFLSSASGRKRWISEYKTEKAKEIINSIHKERFICFCGSVNQAKELGGKKSIHSKNSKKQNEDIINKFNSYETNSLFTCNMGREGMNLSEVEFAVLIQLDNESLYNIQRLGRLLRGESPKIYLIILKGTQDEKYLSKFEKEIGLKIKRK